MQSECKHFYVLLHQNSNKLTINQMKKLCFVAIMMMIQSVMMCALAAKKTAAENLMLRMQKIQKKGYMFGHQDDPFYGITWEWELDRSDTKELVGDYPAVMGFDLGGIEVGDQKNLDSVPFTRIREEIIRHAERGGIITLSWHPRNPLTGTTAWLGNDTTAYNEAVAALTKIGRQDLIGQLDNPKQTVRAMLNGGKVHGRYKLWMSRVAEFILSLKDKNGNQIPLIFRPWHENSGNWFYWGAPNCTVEEYKALWNTTQDYINNVAMLKDYIVWSYSPSYSGNWTEEQFMSRYPGDDRVQLLGVDSYQWGSEDDFKAGLDYSLRMVTDIAKRHGKLIALTECGYVNSPDATWWTRVVQPIIEKYPICYLLPWRNYKKEHFGASKDATTADDFKQWAKQKQFLFAKDIMKIK